MKLVIQIPCFNEAETLPAVLADLPREVPGFDAVEVLVIDDGSRDGTAEVARTHGADHVVRHHGNRGLAAAFLTGLETALSLGADVIVNTDGDHQYPGEAIPDLVRPIVRGDAELVLGDRRPATDSRTPKLKKLLYRVGRVGVRMVTGMDVNDAPSGFRAMSRRFATHIYLTNPFSYTMETLFQAAASRARVYEIPIRANNKTRPSRLFRGIGEYVRRSGATLLRGFALHSPLRAFTWLSVPFLGAGAALILRFVVFFVLEPERSGHIQSLIAATVCVLLGGLALVFGALGDLIRTNRLLLEDIRVRVRRLELGERPSSERLVAPASTTITTGGDAAPDERTPEA
jgi:glycosyltransferase involved in cell wall biosynthesis